MTWKEELDARLAQFLQTASAERIAAYQRVLYEIRVLGASLVAISPELPDKSLSTVEKNALEFEVLSDVEGDAGRAYRLVFEFSEALKQAYLASGNDLSQWNADTEWHLPIPATYVIDRDGRVKLAFVDPEYRHRLEPAHIVATLRTFVKAA